MSLSITAHARSYQPLVVIGAPRTGTNMLRDVLCRLPGVATWPCDEINYIWRFRHRDVPHDEFDGSYATPAVTKYIRGAFDRMARRTDCRVLVEKTCANSLRVPFVDAVIPEANYVFLVRDGRDVVASAMKRWTAPLDIPYLLKKARFVPAFDLPFYGFRYLQNRCIRLMHREKRLAVWGPRWRGWEEVARSVSLPELCAIQWAECVEAAHRDLADVAPQRVLTLHYEDFVHNPVVELQKIVDRFHLPGDDRDLCAAVADVSIGSVGKSKSSLAPEIFQQITPHIERALQLTGYEEPPSRPARAA